MGKFLGSSLWFLSPGGIWVGGEGQEHGDPFCEAISDLGV